MSLDLGANRRKRLRQVREGVSANSFIKMAAHVSPELISKKLKEIVS